MREALSPDPVIPPAVMLQDPVHASSTDSDMQPLRTAHGCTGKKTPHSAFPLFTGSQAPHKGRPGRGRSKWGRTEPLMGGELVIQTTFPVPVPRART